MTIALLLTNCKKNETYQSYFYTTSGHDSPLFLYVDGQYKGELPVMNQKPTFGNDTLKQKALFLTLKSGSYKVEAMDSQGAVKSSGKVTFSKSRSASTGRAGGQSMDLLDDCVIIGLW